MIRLALLSLAITACTPHRRVPDPTPIPVHIPDGACEAADARLLELRCVGIRDGVRITYTTEGKAPSGTPLWRTPDGDSFADACHYAASQGRAWKAECVATIERCEDFDAAYTGELCR